MVETKHLFVTIGGKYILEDISIQIKNSKVTAILGSNGAGKSTLLKCLTGSQKASSGTITLNKKLLSDYSLNDLSIKRAVLSQSNMIIFPFTALEIVMMGRNPYAKYSNKDYKIALEILECVDAIHLKERVFPTLSGGEQQRVQIARVLAQLWEQENAYLFLDEPTSALDLKHQHQLLELVSRLAKEKLFAVCIIIHDLNLAMRYADEVILLKDGKLFKAGTSAKILCAKNIENVFQVSSEMVFGNGLYIKNQPNLS